MAGRAAFLTLFIFPSIVLICIVFACSSFGLVNFCSFLAYFPDVFARFFAKSYYLTNASNSSSTDFPAFSFSAARAIAAACSSYSFCCWSFFYLAVSRFFAGYFVFFPPLCIGAGGSSTAETGFNASTSLHKSSCSENIVFFFFFGYSIVII